MFTGDKSAGMVGSIAEVFPDAAYQRCAVHFCCNVLAKVPKSKRPRVAAMLKAIHAMELREASKAKALAVALELDGMKLKEAAGVARDGYVEALTYARFPVVHWRRIRSNNAIEPITRKTRRRTRIVGTFPDGRPALMLVTARRKYVAEGEWGSRRHLDVTLLEEWPHGADLGGCWKVRRNLDGTFADDSIAAAVVNRVVPHGRLVELSGPSHRPEEPLMLRKSGSLDASAPRTEMLA